MSKYTEHQAVTGGIFYCRVSAKINGCGTLQTSSLFDSDVLRSRQQKHTANPLPISREKGNSIIYFDKL